MKELSIEEKAKRYDEAIEIARKFATDLPNGRNDRLYHVWDLESIFPELKESEDESIRKTLIHIVKGACDKYGIKYQGKEISEEKLLAWLERQGEPKPNPYSGTSFEYNGHTWGMCARDNGVEILIDGHIKGRVFTDDSHAKEMFMRALERVEEQNSKGYKLTDCDKNTWWEDFKAYTSCSIVQKPTNNVEPKFHKEDWVAINPELRFASPLCIKYIDSNNYRVESVDGNSGIPTIDYLDNHYHLWTLQDAKDGDILASYNDENPFIFKGCIDPNNPNSPVAYCGINFLNKFYVCGTQIFRWTNFLVHPAEKAQREFLFQKMKEAGYEWDANKKELKRTAHN